MQQQHFNSRLFTNKKEPVPRRNCSGSRLFWTSDPTKPQPHTQIQLAAAERRRQTISQFYYFGGFPTDTQPETRETRRGEDQGPRTVREHQMTTPPSDIISNQTRFRPKEEADCLTSYFITSLSASHAGSNPPS